MRVRIALAERGAVDDVQFITIEVPAGAHHEDDFIAKNPVGTVPVLELGGGTTIAKCKTITEYIDHSYIDGTPLTGRDPKERVGVRMMQRRAEAEVLDAVGAQFNDATPDLETYQNRDRGEKQRERALSGMRHFDTVLADNAFVAGENYSKADITVFGGLGFADVANIAAPDECPHFLAWRARIASRPVVSG